MLPGLGMRPTVENWDLAEALWDHAFANELRLTVKEVRPRCQHGRRGFKRPRRMMLTIRCVPALVGLSQQPQHPVLFAEPTHAPASQREKLTELFFEKYNVPALYVSKSAVLSAYVARPLGRVLTGHRSFVTTRRCPAVDAGDNHCAAFKQASPAPWWWIAVPA